MSLPDHVQKLNCKDFNEVRAERLRNFGLQQSAAPRHRLPGRDTAASATASIPLPGNRDRGPHVNVTLHSPHPVCARI